MLIIFDLDDTLIDTTSIVPVMLEKALRKMIEEDLSVSFSEGLKRLLEIDKRSIKAKESLKVFLSEIQADNKFYEIAVKEYYTKLPDHIKIFTLPGAKDILDELKKKHLLAILSIGKKSIQIDKLKKAGIDSALFSKIVITESEDKKPYYKEILDSLNYQAKECVACGDRISYDLKPAKELGCNTIHVKWGRGLNLIKDQYTDYSIDNLYEIPKIIKSWEKI